MARATAGRQSPAWSRVALYAVLGVAAVCAVLPFLYMVTASLKSLGDVINNAFWPWPPLGGEAPQWQNYPDAIRDVGWDRQWQTWLFVRYFANSLVVAAISITAVLATASLAAYALAGMNLPGRNAVFVLILATIMVPSDLTLVPKVVMVFNLKLYNSYAALVAPYLTSVFGIFLLRQFFMQMPRDLFDAAFIDGAGHLRYLWSVVLPLSRPAVVTLGLLQFIWTWDEFRWPLLVTRDGSMRVLSVGLQLYQAAEGGTQVHLVMAVATMMVAPVIAVYFLTQRHFTQGFITSGIKG